MELNEKITKNIEEYNKRLKKVFYVAGPITGAEGFKKNFAEAEAMLVAKGYAVINPTLLPDGMKYESYIKICKSMIEEADAVYMLLGWENSEGAKIEKAHAEKLGKLIACQEW